MSKRHYQSIAETIARQLQAAHAEGDTLAVNLIHAIALKLASEFASDNALFQRGKFLAVCGLEG